MAASAGEGEGEMPVSKLPAPPSSSERGDARGEEGPEERKDSPSEGDSEPLLVDASDAGGEVEVVPLRGEPERGLLRERGDSADATVRRGESNRLRTDRRRCCFSVGGGGSIIRVEQVNRKVQ